MESPPLDVSREYIASADLALLSGGYGPGAGALVVIAGVVALVEYPGYSRDARARLESYRAAISDNNAWPPTRQLADAAAGMLKSDSRFDVSSRPGVAEIPGIVNRDRTNEELRGGAGRKVEGPVQRRCVGIQGKVRGRGKYAARAIPGCDTGERKVNRGGFDGPVPELR